VSSKTPVTCVPSGRCVDWIVAIFFKKQQQQQRTTATSSSGSGSGIMVGQVKRRRNKGTILIDLINQKAP
jgi:hypothetical protein